MLTTDKGTHRGTLNHHKRHVGDAHSHHGSTHKRHAGSAHGRIGGPPPGGDK